MIYAEFAKMAKPNILNMWVFAKTPIHCVLRTKPIRSDARETGRSTQKI
jgi:hypothetical protein